MWCSAAVFIVVDYLMEQRAYGGGLEDSVHDVLGLMGNGQTVGIHELLVMLEAVVALDTVEYFGEILTLWGLLLRELLSRGDIAVSGDSTCGDSAGALVGRKRGGR